MGSVVHRPGSLEAELGGQSQLQDIRWEVSQSNLNLVATKEALEKHGVRMEEGLREGFRDVSERIDSMDRTLVQGVVTLHTDLMSVEGSVRDLSAKFEFGIAQLEAGIGDVRDSLQDLVRLAKSPEQTWAYEQYDLARDAYRRDLFPEALEHVNRAISGYQGRTGHRLEHRFHRLLGMIYRTRSPDVMDLPKSKQAYLDAARYAGKDHAEDAAWALYAAARLSFDARDINDAEELFRRALTFADFGEGRYWLAKVLMHQHKVEPGVAELDKAIEADPLYSVKCFDKHELDFFAHEQEVRAAINRWRDVLLAKVQRMAKAAEEAATEVTDIGRVSRENVQSAIPQLTRRRRFNNLPAMSLPIAQQVTVVYTPHLQKDMPYLILRDAYDRRSHAISSVSTASKEIVTTLDALHSALDEEVRKERPWGEDTGAEGIGWAATLTPTAFWLALAFPREVYR